MIDSPGVSVTVTHHCGAQVEIPMTWGEAERRNYFCDACGTDAVLKTEDIDRLHEHREAFRNWLMTLEVARKNKPKRR